LSTSYHYLLCGWHTISDIQLTAISTVPYSGSRADVTIILAESSPLCIDSGCPNSSERSFFRVDGVASYEVLKGSLIRVQPVSGAAKKDIEIYLLGMAWGALCHQRGILPLHASAIATDTGIAAFVGHSGAGKSTTAALVSFSDFELIADDILPISFNQTATPGAWPYLRRLKLKADTIRRLALDGSEKIGERFDERYFVHPKHISMDKWRKLDRIYVLEKDADISHAVIDRLSGVDAVHAFIDHTYRYDCVLQSGSLAHHLSVCSELARAITVYRLRRPWSLAAGHELRSIIRSHLMNQRQGGRSQTPQSGEARNYPGPGVAR